MRLGEVVKAMFQRHVSHFELIFGVCFLTNRKGDFLQVEKATIQLVDLLSKVIFCLFTSPKCDLSEVEKATFQRLVSHFELIFGLLTFPKCDLAEVE